MAKFEEAIGITLLWEGGYSNNPADSGGETYRGISRKNWPLWTGWLIVDRAKSRPDFPRCLDLDAMLQGLVVQFYRRNFWEYDPLDSQPIANKLFDLGVNVGKVHAHKIAQKAAGVTPDGILGPATIAALNVSSNGSLLTAIKQAAEDYHKSIVFSHPQDAVFLSGWLKRDES